MTARESRSLTDWLPLVANSMPFAALLVDADERIVYANASARALAPLDTTLAFTAAPREVLLDPSDDNPDAGIPPVYIISFPQRRLVGAPIQQVREGDRLIGTVWRLRDPESLSEDSSLSPNSIYQRLFEKAIQFNYQLIETNQQLQKAQARLLQQEKLASIGQLAAGVAHELNNPIGFVNGNFSALQKFFGILTDYIEILRGEVGCAGEDARRRITDFEDENQVAFILDDIGDLFADSRDGVERITSIVQSLRQFSHIDFDDEIQQANLNESIQNTLAVAHNEIKYVADVHLDLGDIPHIECIAGEINQVLLNVILNAAQAIQSQHRKDRGRVDIRTRADDGFIRIEICDDGPGIPSHIQHRIYDPFYTTKDVGEGTGLGLNIAYDIVVNKHRGELHLDSVVGKGAAFTILLPVQFHGGEGV